MDAEALLAEAAELVEEQRKARGYRKAKTLEGKPCMLVEPYIPTDETEARAQRILYLRRRAARLLYA